ncbi:hypothetical protein F5B22DRAFT_32557 [Xylaria bambusicola]|uniref:uncharacterized protein n=1 Tax=Xylaria bambusicola TaxID=326684 RepID=UPI002008C64C|nr:uncharacterized protein F5B22DRAFT_32557 [Xylaria bambusicola]KAI0520959.1 hypothetical protein F5B22DRAFT_32557 [Xylaria bambusicola]
MIHQPDHATVDLIFVHGLGGHSIKTWSKNHDASLFWPQLWLPSEPGVENARIFTFGYDAAWRGAGKSVSDITDFAKELLFEMRFGKDAAGEELNFGINPIIFVVHSMGGLVTKKACLLGQQDATYQGIIQAVSAIIFLSTPHRGTYLAKILNRVLSASFQSSKNFISDLDKGSSAIEELNEQFRRLAPNLSIWSFYETLATLIGPRQIMVLEKDSSVLGYPGEISRSLQADHHDVCKFSSPTDPNYITVRNAIKTLIAQLRDKKLGVKVIPPNNTVFEDEMMVIQDHFHNCPSTETDYDASRRAWIPGTCEWFLEEEAYISWLSPSSPKPAILWYTAPPANGKTVLSAFIVNRLRSKDLSCQFYMFKYSDNDKSMVVNCVKSLAYQLSTTQPEFRKLLACSSREGLGLASSDPFLIWKNIIESIVLKSNITTTIYWVIDALDECNSPKTFLECLKTFSDRLPIRILILSRDTESISMGMNRLSRGIPVLRIEKSTTGHNQKDIERLVKIELDHMRGSSQFRDQLLQEIMERSEGNFLWVQHVLEEVASCHTEAKIREVLDDIPSDMTLMFRRMENNLIDSVKGSDKPLITALLEWTTCAQRPLSLREMSQALQPEFGNFLDLKRTIKDTCGQFVQVDSHGKVILLHHTTREYFTHSSESELRIDPEKCHERLFAKALSVFKEDLRWRLLRNQHDLESSEPFVFYAAVTWPFHLAQSATTSSECLEVLVKIFSGPGVLVWIHSLALLRRLEILVTASHALIMLIKNIERCTMSDPLPNRSSNLKLLGKWAIDLTKLVGRFSNQILSNPGVLYSIVPAICPQRSIVYKKFHKAATIKVTGVAKESWSDNLCRLFLPDEAEAQAIACTAKHLAVLDFTGSVHVWDASNFLKISTIYHGEPVIAFAISNIGDRLCTFGLTSTKLWLTLSGELLESTANPKYIKARDIVFADNDSSVLLGGDDNVIRHLACDKVSQGWQVLNSDLLKTIVQIDGALTASPNCLAFNGDRTLVGISFRGAPLYVWRLGDGACIKVYKRTDSIKMDQACLASNWFTVNQFIWNRVTGHVLGICKGGWIFKWHPITDERTEMQFSADEIAASPNGKLFATGSTDGSIQIWSFSHFTVIYQLVSEDLVTAIAFSSDSRRFHNVSFGTVNTWESASMIRFLETDWQTDARSAKDQFSTHVSPINKGSTNELTPITAFSLSPDNRSYCVGYEHGQVDFYQRGSTKGKRLSQFRFCTPIVNIQWSPDCHSVAIRDLSSNLQIWRLCRVSKEDILPSVLPKARFNLGGYYLETILFSLDGKRILIVSRKGDAFVWSTEDGKVTAESRSSKPQYEATRGKWLCHPRYSDIILRCTDVGVYAHRWDNLAIEWTTAFYQEPQKVVGKLSSLDSRPWAQLTIVKRAILTDESQHIILFTTDTARFQEYPTRLRLVPVTTLRGRDEVALTNATFDSLSIPLDIVQHILNPLGILPGRRLVFIDRDLWVCSYPLGKRFYSATGALYNRFYFIPRNWVSANSVEQCQLADDGTLFWPRGDRVVLIECNLDETKPNSVF